jgi:serine/threonine-protein kinase PknG
MDQHCAQCGSIVDEDGYCEDYGHPAGAADPAPAAPRSAPSFQAPSSSTGRSTGRLGVGLADLPSVPVTDPESALMTDPAVPEKDRYCPLGHEVGRSRGERAGRTAGFCPECGSRFDFTPSLQPGDLVAGQYEIRGCIAHGGLGWIYLAADRNLDGKWVVLKGLLNSNDPSALAAAEAERRFLIAVDHPGIVKIHNFVQHTDPRDERVHGYLVMEYVGGVSLGERWRAHMAEHYAPLPAVWAVPCVIEVLAAFQYLHDLGMVYCDLKPGNIIQAGNRVKLIDLGAMRRIGDDDGDVWGTLGYQAPEIGGDRTPDVASDLYTVGRTLAVLTLAFSPAQRDADGRLVSVPLPSRPDGFDESLYRFLERACHTDPAERFASAADMAEQLTAVLRQIRALADGTPYPAVSAHFGPERGAFGAALSDSPPQLFAPLDTAEAKRILPAPLIDPADPAAAALTALALQPAETALGLIEALQPTPETRLARIRLTIEAGGDAAPLIDAPSDLDGDWRLDWYRGVAALDLATTRDQASKWFAKVRSRLPGELAPLLALGICEELRSAAAGDRAVEQAAAKHRAAAAAHYDRIWRTDRTHTCAAFGLARTTGDTAPLEQVPPSSSHHLAARQLMLAGILRRGTAPEFGTALTGLLRAASLFDDLAGLDSARADLLEAELWQALGRVLDGGSPGPGTAARGVPLTRESVASAHERVLRRIAARCASPRVKWQVVAEANRVRPRTWL